MDLEEIFLLKLHDLRGRAFNWPSVALSNQEQYDALMAAPLLREILFGGPPLLDIANREHRMTVTFECGPIGEEAPITGAVPVLHFMGTGFDARGLNPRYVKRLDKDAFLKAQVATLHGDPISVYDVIDFAANAAGGVHFASMGRKNREVVNALNTALRVNGWQPALYSLLAIGRVVVTALEPLAERVRADYSR